MITPNLPKLHEITFFNYDPEDMQKIMPDLKEFGPQSRLSKADISKVKLKILLPRMNNLFKSPRIQTKSPL